MEAKIFGIAGLMALVFVALPVQAQSVYSYGYHGTTGFSSSELTGQLALDGARVSLGYVEGGPSVVTPEAQKELDYVAAITKAYKKSQAEDDRQIRAIMANADEIYERAMRENGTPVKHKHHAAPPSSSN